MPIKNLPVSLKPLTTTTLLYVASSFRFCTVLVPVCSFLEPIVMLIASPTFGTLYSSNLRSKPLVANACCATSNSRLVISLGQSI